MSNDLTLHIQGPDASELSDALQALLQQQLQQNIQVKKQAAKQASENDKSLETVLAVTSFIMAVPGFFLAMETLMNRLGNKDKLDTLAKHSEKLTTEHKASVWIMIDDKPYKLESQNTQAIHEVLAKRAALQ